MFKSKLLLLVLITIATSCGNENNVSNTKVSFVRSNQSGSTGGLIVSGFSPDSSPPSLFVQSIASGEHSLSIELPNGNWDFAAVGWTENSPVTNMSGELRCSQDLSSQSLDGTLTSIALNVDKEQCGSDPFNNDDMMSLSDEVLPLRVITCDTSVISSRSTKSNLKKNHDKVSVFDSNYPALTNNCQSNVGSIKSFKVVFPTIPLTSQSDFFSAVDDWDQSLLGFPSTIISDFTSSCFDVTTGGTYVDTTIQLPLKGHSSLNDHMFHPIVLAYQSDGCSGSSLVYDLVENDEKSDKEIVFNIVTDTRVSAYLLDHRTPYLYLNTVTPTESTILCFDTSVSLIFSTEIDEASILVSDSAGSSLEASLSGDYKNITITPTTTTSWFENESGGTNTLSLSGSTTDGEQFSIGLEYGICAGTETAATLAVNGDGNLEVTVTGGDYDYIVYDWRENGTSLAVGNYALAESGNIVKDYSTYQNHGTLHGTAQYNSSSDVAGAGALQFIATDDTDYMSADLSVLSGKSHASLFSKAKIDSNSGSNGYALLLGWDDSYNYRFNLTVRPPTSQIVGFASNGSNISVGDTISYIMGNWHTYGLVFDGTISQGSRVTLYHDGSNLGSGDGAETLAATSYSSNFAIGHGERADFSFQGLTEYALVFDRTLSSEQMQLLHNDQLQLLHANELTLGATYQVQVSLIKDGEVVETLNSNTVVYTPAVTYIVVLPT